MPAVTLGVLGTFDYAKELGKKGTESDVALYTFKEGDTHVSMIVPFRYPEKLAPLAYAVNACDAILVVVDAINRDLGEQLVAAAAAGHDRGLIVLRNYLQPEQIAPLLKGTTLESLAITTDDKPAEVRQKILDLATEHRDGDVRIPIDHHFNVKGIGTVILGFVDQGTVNKHDTLRVYPSTKTCIVRSIQVHDVDVATAQTGDHVGLALKNITNEDLGRGNVLAPDDTLRVADAKTRLKVNAHVSPFFKPGLASGGVVHVGAGWQFVPARIHGDVAAGHDGTLELELEAPLVLAGDDRLLIMNLDNAAQRIVGHALLA